MNDNTKVPAPGQRRWPWFVFGAVVLGIVLFVVWVWFAVQHVKRIKASTRDLNARLQSAPLRPSCVSSPPACLPA